MIIGAGMSGLAAGICLAYYDKKVLIWNFPYKNKMEKISKEDEKERKNYLLKEIDKKEEGQETKIQINFDKTRILLFKSFCFL